jgi:hypothetical protein
MRRRDYVLFSARFNYIGTSSPSAVPFAAENYPLPGGGHGLRCCRSLVASCFVLEDEMAGELSLGVDIFTDLFVRVRCFPLLFSHSFSRNRQLFFSTALLARNSK